MASNAPFLATRSAPSGSPWTVGRRGLLGRSVQSRGAGFGLVIIVLVLLTAISASVIAPYNPNQIQSVGILTAPSPQYPLGTDAIGRDTLSRIIFGTRVSILAGAVSVGVALTAGVLIGLVAGYHGGWIDDVLMRIVDALYSFPALLLALAITAILGPGLVNVMLAIGVVFTPAFARLVRGQALSVREHDFVMAARVTGARPWRIMAVHNWPNVIAPIIVQASLQVAAAIVIEAGLSFLGLGVQPPAPSWGSMLKEGYQYMEQAPWLAFAPGAAIFVTVLAFNLFGDGLRQALDPRMARRVDV
jgi:peptide/nickel transport system permease protein